VDIFCALHNIKTYILLVILGVFFITCSKEKYEAKEPTYISIDEIVLTTNYAVQGSASSNITDAWVFINDDLVGVYELPATFPVLKEGNAEVKIYAGIKDNGIAASRARYLLYDPHVEQLNLVPGETIMMAPSVTYSSGVNFAWLEDFENASLSFLYHQLSDTIVFKQSSGVKEGSFSGKVFLDANMDFFEATSIAFTTIPKDGSKVYLELDFKTNEPVLLGVYHDNNQYGYVNLSVTEEWTKIYINLTSVVTAVANSSEIKIFMGVENSLANPFITANPEIHLDNIKLVHY
jgi:hypothetical protein